MNLVSKSFLMTIAASALLAVGSVAKASPDCEQINLSGIYKSEKMPRQVFNINQQGCIVNVYDLSEHAKWTFDLSGTKPTTVPNTIIEKSKDSELGYKTLKSVVIQIPSVNLDSNQYFQDIPISAEMNAPRVRGNRFDVDIAFKGHLLLFSNIVDKRGYTTGPIKNPDGRIKITSINLYGVQARLTRIRDSIFKGVLGDAFLTGANYILGQLDVGAFSATQISFQRIK